MKIASCMSSFDIIYTRRECSLLNDSSLLGVQHNYQVDSSLCIIIIKFSNVWDFNLWVSILKCYRELVLLPCWTRSGKSCMLLIFGDGRRDSFGGAIKDTRFHNRSRFEEISRNFVSDFN